MSAGDMVKGHLSLEAERVRRGFRLSRWPLAAQLIARDRLPRRDGVRQAELAATVNSPTWQRSVHAAYDIWPGAWPHEVSA